MRVCGSVEWNFQRLTRVNSISILIRDLNAELLLNRHHYLHGVQAVQAKVVGKVRGGLDLFDDTMICQCFVLAQPSRAVAWGE